MDIITTILTFFLLSTILQGTISQKYVIGTIMY